MNSKRVAELIGFKPTNKELSNFVLSEDDFNWSFEKIEEKNNFLTDERLNQLLARLSYCHKDLMRISNELRMSYDRDEDLLNLVEELSTYHWKIEDLVFSERENQS